MLYFELVVCLRSYLQIYIENNIIPRIQNIFIRSEIIHTYKYTFNLTP